MEELKRFSIRDGMDVERLRKWADVEVGIVTGENSLPVVQRAAKLKIKELHLGCKDKAAEGCKPPCFGNVFWQKHRGRMAAVQGFSIRRQTI